MKKYPFCPNCGNEEYLKEIEKSKNIDIKGKQIPVKYKVIHCSSCNFDFTSLDEKFDVIEKAREKYRKMFGIPSPDEIGNFMKKYKLSLRDMEALTGIAFKTIDRYLKGGIPDPSNAKFLKILLNSIDVVKELMDENDRFSSKRFRWIKQEAFETTFREDSFETLGGDDFAFFYTLNNVFVDYELSKGVRPLSTKSIKLHRKVDKHRTERNEEKEELCVAA